LKLDSRKVVGAAAKKGAYELRKNKHTTNGFFNTVIFEELEQVEVDFKEKGLSFVNSPFLIG
jgi:hypothetical protein